MSVTSQTLLVLSYLPVLLCTPEDEDEKVEELGEEEGEGKIQNERAGLEVVDKEEVEEEGTGECEEEMPREDQQEEEGEEEEE